MQPAASYSLISNFDTMRRPLYTTDLEDFYRNRVRPSINDAVSDAINVVFVDLWNSYQLADRKTIWYGGQLYWCHKERIEEGGIISDEWVQDFIPLRTDILYIDKEHDAQYRWDGSAMVPMGSGGGITVVETDLQTYEGMASHDASTLYVITSLTPSS